jgi:hypothetical protein
MAVSEKFYRSAYRMEFLIAFEGVRKGFGTDCRCATWLLKAAGIPVWVGGSTGCDSLLGASGERYERDSFHVGFGCRWKGGDTTFLFSK